MELDSDLFDPRDLEAEDLVDPLDLEDLVDPRDLEDPRDTYFARANLDPS